MGKNSKMGNNKKALAKGLSPLQELDVGKRSGPYLNIISKILIEV